MELARGFGRRTFMRVFGLAVALGLAGATAACGTAPIEAGAPKASASPPTSTQTVPADRADFHLFVSNQSFIERNIHLTVMIDGTAVAVGRFAVEGQHNWETFPLKLGAGTHRLTARAESGAQTTETFDLPAIGVRYAVLNYWNYKDDPKRFSWDFSVEPPAFG